MNNLLNHRYEIIKPLSSGGFGHTYLAEDTQMPSRRKCVIKQLKPLTQQPEIYQIIQERFKREAAILEKLGNNSNQIPKLYAYFEEEEQFYLVQEWIEGESLSEKIIKQGILTEKTVELILREILPVIDYLHQNNIIHRDIKPANIMIRDHDQKPVLIDFGAVKETMGTVLINQEEIASTIVIGTPGYMSAEQGAGRPVYSSDLYALGLSAIYLLTGKSPQNLNTNLNTGEIEWKQDQLNINSHLETILNKAIRYNLNERYHTAQEMLKDLTKISSNQPLETVLPQNSHKITFNNYLLNETQLEINNPFDQLINLILKSKIKSLIILTTLVSLIILIPVTQKILFTFNLQNHQSLNNHNLTDKITPEQAINNYYNYINQGQYETGWKQLGIEHQRDKNRHPKGYQSYLEWWTSVKLVTVISTNVIRQTDNTAIVETDLHYEMKQGRSFDQKLRFTLIWDNSLNGWSINWVDVLYSRYL